MPALIVLATLALWVTLAVRWFVTHGYSLYFGDAAAHLNVARRIIDSRTPGYDQIGTVWLPLPHLLMLPFAGNNEWWRTGLAGALPGGVCLVLAAWFLFLAARRALGGNAAGVLAMAVFVLNPNLLYLSSAPMTEAVFFLSLFALLYTTVAFLESQSWLAVLGAGVAAGAGTLTRYEAWFLIPFCAVYFLLAARNNRLLVAVVFSLIAGLGPLYWFGHNWWYYGDVLEFYWGPYSAKAIYQRALDQGMARYPGDHEWQKAIQYFAAAARLCAGWPLAALGIAGACLVVIRKAWWPLVLLALPPLFYISSIYSSGTPIFVPHLWPNSYYNTRYGLALLPLLAFGAAGLAAWGPPRLRSATVAPMILLASVPWIFYPRAESWICWKESQANSEGRRAWTREAAAYLKARYRAGSGIYSTLGDIAGIYEEAGIPLKEVLQEGNNPHWEAVRQRPDLFLWEEWAIAISGDAVAGAIQKLNRPHPALGDVGPRYDCVKIITVKDAPAIEIYRRYWPSAQHALEAQREIQEQEPAPAEETTPEQ